MLHRGKEHMRVIVSFLALTPVIVGLAYLRGLAPESPSLTPEGLNLSSTFEAISVRAKFSGDSDADSTATIRFRQAGELVWHEAYPPVIDRRTDVNGVDNTLYAFEARGSIVGLTSNTAYEVAVTWADPDGIEGSDPIIGVVSTLNYEPPTNGTIRWVDGATVSEGNGTPDLPFRTITNAIQHSYPGDTIMVRAGTYAPFTISKSGTPSAYFVLRANPGDTVAIQGGAAANCITINADYWRIIGFQFEPSVQSSIVVASARHHIYVEENVSQDVGTGNIWGSGGVSLGSWNNHIYILRNRFSRTTQGTDNVDGVFIKGAGSHTLIIADNSFSGNFWDGIGNGVNSRGGTMENSDFVRNTFTDWQDDSIEMDGGSVNLRVWGNTAVSNIAYSALSEGGTIQGPSYVFRNVFVNSRPDGTGIKQGHNGVGYSFFFHNVIETAGAGANEAVGQAGGRPWSENHVFRNNIIKASGNVYYREGRSNSYDYNLLFVTTGAYLADSWNLGKIHETLQALQVETGQELHGVYADPAFANESKTIEATSPAVDVGAILPNFNSPDSAWPYSGSAPDIGVFEVQGP